MADTRLAGSDFLRAAACLVVVAHHLAQRMSWNADLAWMGWLRVGTQLGGFGVAVFFVLSGFLLARPFWQALDAGEPLPSLRIYVLRRAARILPGFWVALTVTFVLTISVFGTPVTAQLLLRYLSGLLLVADWHWVTLFPVEINGPLWSISFEVTSYVLLPLGFAALFALGTILGRDWRARVLWLGVIALALAAHLAFLHFGVNDPIRRGWDYGLMGGAKLWMPKFNPFGFFGMFAVGALAAGLQVSLTRKHHWLFDALALVALAVAIWMLAVQTGAKGTESYGFLGVPYQYPWFQLVIGAILAFTPSSVVVGRVLDNPATRYVARISFGIYVWHYLVLELIRLIWLPDAAQGSMTDPTRMGFFAGAVVAVSFAIAHASYYLMEAPVIRWARSIEGRFDGASPTLSPAAG